jgi:hypothetical protein
VLGQIGFLAARPGDARPAESNPSPRALATARAFYEGLDRLLATGDRSIEATVAPGFVDHPSSGQEDRTLQEMIDELLALRATLPHLRVTVLDLEQRDHQIAVRLEVDPGAPSSVLGVALEAPPPHQLLEFLSVEGAGVTERWEASGQLPAVLFSMGIDVRWDGTGVVVPAIQHILLDPGRSMQLPHAGSVILRTEAGSVQLDREGVDLDEIRRPIQEPLDAGQVRVLDGNDPVMLRNVSSVPAELWALSANSSFPASAAPAQPRFVAFIPLPLSSEVRSIPRRLSVVRISLPPGATIPAPAPGVIQTAVLDGALEVTVDNGRALVCRNGKTTHPFDDTVTITAGQGVSAKETASLSYRVVGPQPTTILIMQIDSSPPTTPAP